MGTLGIFATPVYVFTMHVVRHTEYGNNSHTIDFHTVLYFVLYTIVNFTTHFPRILPCITYLAIFTILYGNYYSPHGEFKLICIGKFARRT